MNVTGTRYSHYAVISAIQRRTKGEQAYLYIDGIKCHSVEDSSQISIGEGALGCCGNIVSVFTVRHLNSV